MESKEYAKEYGKYLQSLRNKKGYTLDQLSEVIGYSNPYISQIENGHKGIPAPKLLKKISEALDVPYLDLLQKAGHIEEAEREGLMKSADLYTKYRKKRETDLKSFYKDNRFDIEELLSYDTTLLYRSVMLSKNDKDKILTFIRDILLNNKDGE